MKKSITIKEGYGDIKFDMPVEEVVGILGEPNDVETIDNATEETTTVLHYNGNLTLFFEGDCPTLSCIDISDEKATLFGKEMFDMGEKELVKLMVESDMAKVAAEGAAAKVRTNLAEYLEKGIVK